MVNFADKFGLPKDRAKLEAGLTDFDIVKVEIKQSKKSYDGREEKDDGTIKLVKKKIDIAYIDVNLFSDDGKPSKEVTKYYSPNAAIVQSCKDILSAYGKPDGTLREPVHIDEVKKGIAESKNEYLYFA